jgi:biotin transport system substrate-specific component
MNKNLFISRCSFAIAFMCLSGPLSIYVPWIPVPFTLQIFSLFLIASVLSPAESFISIFLYLVLGISGFPVFSGGSSGISSLAGPTGGFLAAFPIAGLIISKAPKEYSKIKMNYLVNFIALLTIYSIGIAGLKIHINKSMLNLSKGMIPFLVADIFKIAAALIIARKLNRIQSLRVPGKVLSE